MVAIARVVLAESDGDDTNIYFVGEYGTTSGIVTLKDIVEEIVGEIHSEYELPDAKLEWVGDRAVEVTGSMSIDDFNESMGTDLPQTDARTLAGLVFDSLGRGARKGDTVQLAGVTLRVEQVDGARITQIHVELPNAPATGSA